MVLLSILKTRACYREIIESRTTEQWLISMQRTSQSANMGRRAIYQLYKEERTPRNRGAEEETGRNEGPSYFLEYLRIHLFVRTLTDSKVS